MVNIQPERSCCAFNVQTSAAENGDLRVARVVNIVVCGPEPVLFTLAGKHHFPSQFTHILHVKVACASSDMHGHVSSNASRVNSRAARSYRALRNLEVRSLEAADSRVHIPHAAGRSRGGQVPLNENSSSLGALRGHNHVRPLHLSSLARCANLNHGLRVALVIEEASGRHDDGVFLSNNLRARGDTERAGDAVDTGIKVHDLACSSGTVDDTLQSGRVIGDRVT